MKLKLLMGALAFLIVLNLATIGTFFYTQWKRGGERDFRPFPATGLEAPNPHLPDDAAHNGGPFPMRMHLRPEKRMQLRLLLNEFYAETADTRARIRELERLAFVLLQRDPVPRDSLDAVLRQTSRLRLDVSRAAFENLLETKAHLDPDQQRMFFRAVLEARPEQHGRFGRYHVRRAAPGTDSD